MDFFEQQRNELRRVVFGSPDFILSDPIQYGIISKGAWGVSPLKIKKVIHNKPATIVFWADGTKTVVKAQNEVYDGEKGIAMAYMKKSYNNKGRYFNDIKKWTEQENQEEI